MMSRVTGQAIFLTCRMSVNGNHTNWRSPLVVNLVDPFIEILRVHDAVEEVKPKVEHLMGNQQVPHENEEAGNLPHISIAQNHVRKPIS